MTGKRGIDDIPFLDGPLLSPPATPSRGKRQKLELDHIVETLEEDEKLVTAVDVHHEYSDEFKLQRIILPDQTKTPYLICRSSFCSDLPYKKKVC
jgi:hypothetical protein